MYTQLYENIGNFFEKKKKKKEKRNKINKSTPNMNLNPYYSNPGSTYGNESDFGHVIQLHVLLTNYHNETDRQTRQTNSPTDKQTGGQTDRQTNSQTDINLLVIMGLVVRVVVVGGAVVVELSVLVDVEVVVPESSSSSYASSLSSSPSSPPSSSSLGMG